MEQGFVDLAGLQERLRSRRERAWVSAVARPSGEAGLATLLHLQVVVGVPPPGWQEDTWTYDECIFARGMTTSAQVGAWLGKAGEHRITVGGMEIGIHVPETTVQWRRQPSLARYEDLTLTWPWVGYQLAVVDHAQAQAPGGYLVGAGDTPSFPVFSAAFNAYLRGDFTVSGTGNPSLGQIALRVVDRRARISRVRIRPASVDVWVGGRGLEGTRLELNGAAYRTSTAITKPGRVALPLPEGLPSDAWLWLKDGTQWLDFRSLGGWGGQRSPDIETELPDDPLADLSRLAAQGEGAQLEYKAKLPDTPGEKRTVFKTVAAFANGEGGTILFGIDDDGGIVGLRGGLAGSRRRLNDLVRDLVTPSPRMRIDEHRLDGRAVLVLHVQPGDGVLHALTVEKNRPEYYVRRDGTTFYARPDEVAAVVQQSLQPRGPLWSTP